jgi:hypothetical protein
MNAIQNNLRPMLMVLLLTLIPHHATLAHYDPSLQRWINRDSIGERGGFNLYSFVQNGPLDWFDAFGRASKKPVPITPLPPLPTPMDNCSPEQKQAIEKARDQACDRINKCTSPDCDQAQLQALRDLCKRKDKPVFQCAKSDDADCKPSPDGAVTCAYQNGDVITFCGAAFPADGSNCKGVGGPQTLDCIVIHEMTHEVMKGVGNWDDANKMQKCMGCPTGAPHQQPR